MFADIGSSLEATVALTMTPPFLAGTSRLGGLGLAVPTWSA